MRQRYSRFLLLFAFFLTPIAHLLAADWFSDGSGDFHTLATWNSASNGSGSAPLSIDPGDNFFIESGDIVTIAGGNAISVTDITVQAGGTLTANDNLTLSGNLTVNATGAYNLNATTLTVAGTVTNGGTVDFSSGNVDYNGVGAQNILATTYNTLTLSGGGTKTTAGTVIATNISNSVVFDISTNTLQISGSFSGAGTYDFATGTVNYDGTGAQNVLAETYNNLTISGNAAKTLAGNAIVNLVLNVQNTSTFQTSTHTIQADDLTVDNGGTFTGGSGTVTIGDDFTVNGSVSGITGAIDINGDLLIGGTGGFTESSSTTNLAGNLTNDGTFTANGGVFTFDGGTNSIIDGGTIGFNSLVVNKTGSAVEVEINDGTVVVNATAGLAITQGTFDFQTFSSGHDLGAVSGTSNAIIAIAATAGTVTWPGGSTDLTSFVGTAGTTINYNTANSYNLPATLPGGGTTYQNVIFSGGGTKTATAALDVNGTLTINDATTFADGGFTHTVAGDWTENNAAAQMTGTGTINFDGGGSYVMSSPSGGTLNFNGFTVAAGTTIEHNDAVVFVTGDVLINTGATWNQVGFRIDFSGSVWEELGTGQLTSNNDTRFIGTNQIIRGDDPIDFLNLRIVGAVTVTQEQNISADIIQINANCTLDMATFTATSALPTAALQMASNSTLRVGGTNNYPTDFIATFTGGTVEYYLNGAQNIAGTDEVTYVNLQITGTGNKTAQEAIAADFIDIDAGDFLSNGFNVSSTGDFDMEAGASFTGSAGTVNIGGNLLNDGTFTGGAGDIAITTNLDNNSAFVQGGGNLTVGGTFDNAAAATFDGSAGTIQVTGNFTNNGDFDRGAGDITITTGNFSNAAGTFDAGTGTGNLIVSTGTATNDAAMDFSTGGNITVTSNAFINSNGSTFDGGTGTISAFALVNAGDFDRGAGDITVTAGAFTNTATGAFDAGTGNGNLIVTAGAITNSGALDFSGGGNITANNGIFSNANGATFDGGAGTINVHTLTNSGDFDRGAGDITISTGDFTNNATGVFDDGTGSGNLTVSTGNIVNSGTLSFTGGNVSTAGNFTNNTGAPFTGGTGTVTISGDLTNDGTFSGVSGAIDIDGNLTIGATGAFTESSSTTNLEGNLTSTGTFSANGGTFTFDGGTNSIIDGATINFNNLVVNKTSSTVEVEVNDAGVVVNAATALTITQGTFDFQTFGGNGHDLGNVNGTANAIIAIAADPAATVAWPGGATNLTNFVSTAGTTINYNTANSYNIPTTLPGGITTYQNVTFSEGGVKTATAALDVNGNVTFNDATTFADGGFTHTVAGNWTENNAAAAMTGTGTIQFDGTSVLTDVTGSLNFNNVIIDNAASVNAGASPITMTGNWTENTATSVFTGTGTVTFTGATGSINGTEPIAFGAVTVDNGDQLTINQNISITNDLSVNANATYETNTFTTTGGNDINMGTDGLIRVGGASNFPSGFNAATFTTGTVEFYLNGAQDVPGTDVVTYFNLQSTGTGNKTAQNTISTNFIDMDAGTLVSNNNDISSTGDMDIENGASIDASSGGNINAGDDILNDGTVTGGSGTITTTDDIRNGATGVITQGTGDVTVGDDLVNDGTYTGNTGAIGVSGDLDNDGAFTQGDGNITVALTFDNANGATFDGAAGTMQVTGDFTNNGDFDRGSGAITVTTGNFLNSATGVFDDGTGGGNLTVTTGNFTNAGTAAFAAGNVLITAGDYSNSGTYTGGTGTFTITAGTFDNTATGTFTNGTGLSTVTVGTAVNDGIMNLTGDGDFYILANSFTNGTAAQFTMGEGYFFVATDLVNNATGAGFFTGGVSRYPLVFPLQGFIIVGGELDNNGNFNAGGGSIVPIGDLNNSGTFNGNTSAVYALSNITNETGGTLTPNNSNFLLYSTLAQTITDVDQNTAKFAFDTLTVQKFAIGNIATVAQGTMITSNSTNFISGTIDLQDTDAGSITSNHNLGNVTSSGTSNTISRLRMSAAAGTTAQFPSGDFTSTFAGETGYFETEGTVIEYYGDNYTLPTIVPCYNVLRVIGNSVNAALVKEMSGDICVDEYFGLGETVTSTTDGTTLESNGFNITVTGIATDGILDFYIDGSTLDLENGSTLTVTNGDMEADNNSTVNIGENGVAAAGATVNIDGADGDGYFENNNGSVFNIHGTSTFTVDQATGGDAFLNNGQVNTNNTALIDLMIGDYDGGGTTNMNGNSELLIRTGDLGVGTLNGGGTSDVIFFNQAADQNIQANGVYVFENLILKKSGFDMDVDEDIRVNGTLELNVYDDLNDATFDTDGGSMFLNQSIFTFDVGADIRGENNVSYQDATQTNAIAAFSADRMLIFDGTVNTGTLVFEGSNAVSTDYEGIYPMGVGTSAAPTSYQYNYLQVTDLNASQDGTNLPTITLSVIPYPSGLNDVVNKYWVIESANIVSITTADLTFKYHDPEEITRAAGTLEVKRIDGGVEYNVPAGSVDEVGETFTSGAANTFLENEWRMGDLANLPQTYYSFQDGDWDDPNTWTKDPFGLTQTAADIADLVARGAGPDFGDNVFIINGRNVTLTADGKDLTLLAVNDGELFISVGGNHEFPTIIGEANGVLKFDNDNDMPNGDYTDFVAADGGTIEFENNLGTEIQINTTITGLVFNNLTFSGTGQIEFDQNYILNGDFVIETNTTCQIDDDPTIYGDWVIKTGATVVSAGEEFVDLYGDLTVDGTLEASSKTYPDYTNDTGNRLVIDFRGSEDATVTANGLTTFDEILISKDAAENMVTFTASNTTNMRFNSQMNDNNDDDKAFELERGILQLTSNIRVPTLTEGGRAWEIQDNATLWINGAEVYSTSTPGNTSNIYAVEVQGKLLITAGFLDTRDSRGVYFDDDDDAEIEIQGGSLITNSIFTFRNSTAANESRGAVIISGGTVTLNGTGLTSTGNYDAYATFALNSTGSRFVMSDGTLNINGMSRDRLMFINADAVDVSVTGGTINLNDGTGTVFTNGEAFYNLNLAASATLNATLASEITVQNDLNTGSASTLDAAGFTMNLEGDWINDSGTFTPNGNTVIFNSEIDNQEVRGIPTFSTLQVDNSFTGGVVSISSLGASDVTITADLDVQDGDLYLGKYLTVNGNVTNNNTINGPRRLVLSGGAGAHQISGDGTGFFRSIELDDANGATLTADMTLDATLLMTNGVFGLDVYTLNMNATADIDEGGAGFDNTRMVTTAGNASDGGINRTYSSTGSFTFPLGTGTIYTPATINVSAASTFGSIRVSPAALRHPVAQGAANALTYYWDVEQTGFTGITATHTYTYDASDVVGTETSYVSGYYTGAWTQGTTADVDETNNIITFSGLNLIAGAFTAGETTAFAAPTTYYSLVDGGNWSTATTWSTVSHVGAPAATPPTAADKVVIGNNHTINADANSHVSASIRIDNGATLDLAGFVSHNFGDYEGTSGSNEGELRITIPGTNQTAEFPGGDWGEFLGTEGGTTEYYYSTGTNNSFLELPANVSTYYNLHINNQNNDDDRRIYSNTQKLTIYNDMILEDNTTLDGSLGEFRLYCDLDIGNDLTLNGGAEFNVQNNAAHTIEIGGNFSILNGNGDYDMEGDAIHNMYIGGNVVNHGDFDADDGDSRSTRIHFEGSTNRTWTGNAETTLGEASDVGQLIINFDDTTTMLTVNDPKFRFSNATISFTGFTGLDLMNLRFIRGIVQFQDVESTIDITSSYTLPSDGEIWINGSSVIVETNGNLELGGVLRVTDGTFNVGDAGNERLEPLVGGRSRIEMEGGTLNVGGKISRTTVTTAGDFDYRQSGGTVNIGIHAPNSNNRGSFELLNDSYFEMTGGTIVLSSTGPTQSVPAIYIQPTSYKVTGGTFVIGDAGTGAETFEINSTVPLYNVQINTGANNGHNLTIEDNPLQVLNDLDIQSNTTLIANGQDLYIGGDYDNQGVYTYGTNKTYFNNTSGSGNQDLTASGTGTLDFYDVEVVSQVTVQPVGIDMTVNNDLTISLGTLQDNGQRITVRHDVDNDDTHASTGGGELLILDDDIQNVYGDGTGIFGNLRLDNANNVQLNANARITGSLSFTNGNFLIGDNELTFGQTATISGAGTDKMIVTDGLSSDAGVIKELASSSAFNFTFPVGDGTIYTPANFASSVDPTASGEIRVIRVADKHPATQDPLETQLDYYWKVSSSGLTSATVTHQYTYDQSSVPSAFTETNGSAVVGRFFNFEWTEGTTDVGSFNTVTNIITVAPGGAAASFIDGDYTIGYDPEFDTVPRYRSRNASSTWTTASDWEVFTPPATWNTATVAPSSGEIIIIQTGHTMTVPGGTSILATSLDLESNSTLDIDETTGHDFTTLSGTGTLRLASSNFPAGIVSDFVASSGGTIEYGQGSASYTMPALQTVYNNLVINTNTNTVSTATSDLTINGDVTINANGILDNTTNRIDITLVNGDWINNGTFNAGSALVGQDPTVSFTSSTQDQRVQGSSTTSFYNVTVNKAGQDLITDVDMTVDGNLALTAGSIDIADDILTINGTVSGTGTIKGSNTAAVSIGGTTGGSAGTLLFEAGSAELNDFTMNRTGVNGAVTLGADVFVWDVTTMTAGEIVLDGGTLTLDGTIAAGGTGSITGTCTGGLVISDSDGDANALGGELRFTAGAEELGTFTMNKPSTATLGSDLTVCTNFNLTQGQLVLSTNSSHTFTVNGAYSRTTGTITGSSTSNMTIDNGSSATADLVFTSNAAAAFNDFTLSRSTAGPTFTTLDATDEMTISGVMTLNGSSVFDISGAKTLNLNGYTNGSGFMRGSTSTVLNIGGTTDDALGFLNFESGNRIVQHMTMNRTGGSNSTAALGTDLEVDDTFTLTEGAFELNDNSFTMSGSLVRTNGTITGSNGSDMIITGAPANLGGEIHFTSGVTNGQRLRDFTMSKTGTAILGTDLTVRRDITTTSGEVVLPSGTTAGTNTLTLLGNHHRESIGGNGTLTGSNESHIVIQGNGDLGDPLYFTAGSQFIQELDLDRQTNGIVELGTDLRIGEDADDDGALTMTNGEFDINGNTLTLITSVAGYSRTNGTFTGSTTSRMEIQGAGNVGSSAATGTLNFTNNGSDGQQLLDFDITRSGGSAYLGTDLTVLDVFTLEESDFNLGINGNTFTIDGTPVSSGTVGRLIGDNACGGTSRLNIDGVNSLGQIGFNTSGEFFKAFRITNTNATDKTAALISATNLTICDTMELANDSHLGLGGASGNENTVTFEGYLINDGTNTLVGSHFANLIINGSTADNLGGGAATPVYFDALTTDGQYIRSLTLNRDDGASNLGTVTLGTNLNIGDETTSADYGSFTFTDGILELNNLSLRLNSAANNFSSTGATRSVFRGTTTSDLHFFGPGDLGGTVYFIIDGGDADAQVLENFRINRTGGNSGDNEVDLGSNLRVDGELHLEYGRLNISTSSSHIFNINGTLTRNDVDPTIQKVENDGGLIGGNSNGNITIGNSNTSQINLFMDDGATTTRTLRNLTIERVNNGATPSVVLRSELRTDGVLTIPTDATLDMEVNKTGAASNSSRGLLIWGTLAGDGLIQGSFTEDIICNGTIGETLKFEAGARELRSFMMWSSSNTTVGLGTDLTIGDPTATSEMYVDLSVSNTRDNTLILNGNTLTFNSSANRFEDRSNGTLTGDYNATLIINGTGDLGGNLYFESSARELEFLTINRTSTGIATLGTDLTIGDSGLGIPTGNMTLTDGHFEINGNSLTINNDHIRTTGELVGSTTSDLTVAGRGDFAAMVFDVGSAANYTLENLTITRTLDDAGSALDIDMGSDLIVGNSDDGDILTIGDGAVLSLEGNHLTASGTLAFNTSGALRGSYTSDLTLNGLGTPMGTFRFRTDAATDNYVNDFVLNRTSSSGTAIMGSNMNIGQPSTGGSPFDGTTNLTNGRLDINGNTLTINSSANDFTAGANGYFEGEDPFGLLETAASDLIINGPGDFGSAIPLALNFNGGILITGLAAFENLEINRSALTDDVLLGGTLIVGDFNDADNPSPGHFDLNEGTFDLNDNYLYIANDYDRTNGRFRGSVSSQLAIVDDGEAGTLVFDTSTEPDYTVRQFFNLRQRNDAGNPIDIDLGTDLIVGNNGTDICQIIDSAVVSLEGNTLTLRTSSLTGTGEIRGSYTSNLVVEGTFNTNIGTMFFATDAAEDNYLNTFTMNRINGTAGSVTLGTTLNVGEPSGATNEFNGVFTHTAGIFILNGQSIIFNSGSNAYTAGANASFTGDYSADMTFNGTGDFGSNLVFSSGNERLENITINRSQYWEDVRLGTDLTVGDPGLAIPTGAVTLTGGSLRLLTQSLTINNDISRVNGYFEGSTSAEMTIGGRGDANPLYFIDFLGFPTQYTLLNFTITRVFDDAGSALDIDLGSNLIVGTSGSGNLDLNGDDVVLSLEGNDLTINGDLVERNGTIRGINTSNMTFGGTGVVTGTLKFESGDQVLDVFTMNRSGATAFLTMGSALTLEGTNTAASLVLTDGYITTTNTNLISLDGNALVSGATYTDGAGTPGGSGGSADSFINGPIAKTFSSDLGTFRFPVGKNTTFLEAGVKDLSSFPTTFRAEYFDNSHADPYNVDNPSGVRRVSVLEYWDVSRTSGASTAKVLAHWNSASGVTLPADIFIAHYYNGVNGTKWYGEGQSSNAGVATEGYHISANDLSSFSPITHATTEVNNNPLPITLVDFNATYEEGNGVRLDWETVSELNNKGFILKRSIGNPDNFVTIATYDSHDELIGKGTTNQASIYKTWDEEANLKPGEVHYYQLSQEDFDGTITTFKIKAVNIGGEVVLFQNYPNPSQNQTTLSFSTHKEGQATLAIYNTLGQLVEVVYDGQIGLGTHEFEQDLDTFKSGTYLIRLFFEDKVMTKKMVVVK